jgi:hypothetical protein
MSCTLPSRPHRSVGACTILTTMCTLDNLLPHGSVILTVGKFSYTVIVVEGWPQGCCQRHAAQGYPSPATPDACQLTTQSAIGCLRPPTSQSVSGCLRPPTSQSVSGCLKPPTCFIQLTQPTSYCTAKQVCCVHPRVLRVVHPNARTQPAITVAGHGSQVTLVHGR